MHLNSSFSTSSPPYSTCWATDLNLLLDPEHWAEIWISTESSTINILAMEANQKVLAGWYIVPARVAKIVLYNSPNCFRVFEEPGTHLHAFLMLSKLTNSPLSPDPAVVLLNKRSPDLTLGQLKHVLYITTTSKETFAKTLKTRKLCLLETKHRITQALTHSTIEASLLDCMPKHAKIWQPWMDHFLHPSFHFTLLKT